MTVVTRFAPSPTGRLHPGNGRTALYNWLLARREGGRFIVRSEDTDRLRSEDDHLDAILADLAWLGLDWDAGPDRGGEGGPFRQSERGGLYREHLGRLVEMGRAYACWRTDEELARHRRDLLRRHLPPRYDRYWAVLPPDEIARRRAAGQRPVVRFRCHEAGEVRWQDLVRGGRSLPASEVGDFILARADGSAAFMFANAVDDALMGVTHVLRGEDHLVNTARQVALLEALQLPVPRYGHLPLLASKAGERLSKREGSRSLADWREAGLLPGAVVNYLARLGHPWPEGRMMTLQEFAGGFDLASVSTARARLDEHQLEHWQREAVAALDVQALVEWSGAALADVPAGQMEGFIAAVRPNVLRPADVGAWAQVVFGGDAVEPVVAPEADAALYGAILDAWSKHGPDLKALAADVKAATGARGRAFYHPLRLALTGREHGPEMGPLLGLIPAETVRRRLERCRDA
jgi:glutamyl-tRNA synthetase